MDEYSLAYLRSLSDEDLMATLDEATACAEDSDGDAWDEVATVEAVCRERGLTPER